MIERRVQTPTNSFPCLPKEQMSFLTAQNGHCPNYLTICNTLLMSILHYLNGKKYNKPSYDCRGFGDLSRHKKVSPIRRKIY